jgi:hypothetical protein
MIHQHVTPPHPIRQFFVPPDDLVPQLPSPDRYPLSISPPRIPPHLSPPRPRPGSDIFANMVPTHVDVRARALSLSQPKSTGTTAQDLLNGVLGLNTSTNDPAPAASPLFSGLGGLAPSAWSVQNDIRHPPIGQQRHQRSVSQINPPGTRPGNGLGLIIGSSPFLPTSSLPQSSSQLSWQSDQPSQPHTDFTLHHRPNPIGHHRVPSSGVPHLMSPSSLTSTPINVRPAQPVPSAPFNLNAIDTSGGLGGESSNDFLLRRGLPPTSQPLLYNLPFGNSLGIQDHGWER